MNMISTELEDFAIAYIERNTGKKLRKGRDLFAYVRDLDSESFKKLTTACRVAKKRHLDAESGNKPVNVTLTKKAHETLLRMACGVGISTYIESLESKALESNEWLEMANGNSKAWRLKAESLQAEVEQLKALLAKRDTVTLPEPTPKIYQNDKPVDTVKRCQALTTKGTRCKATDNLDSDGKTILCKFHMGILRRTHADCFKLFDGRKI